MNPRIQVSAKRRRSQGGSAILETALSILCYFLIVFGMIEFSQATYAWNFVSYAARNATRYASVHGATSQSIATAQDVTNVVVAQAVALNSSNLTVTTTWSPNNQPGSIVQVQVSYVYNPLLILVFRSAQTFSSTSKMVILQ
ncbi:MAG: TadE/TadG family type IV pilus assembly protein [Bryobacteraceae bacterium]|jgi:Flp pilus assembly protein TadG